MAEPTYKVISRTKIEDGKEILLSQEEIQVEKMVTMTIARSDIYTLKGINQSISDIDLQIADLEQRKKNLLDLKTKLETAING